MIYTWPELCGFLQCMNYLICWLYAYCLRQRYILCFAVQFIGCYCSLTVAGVWFCQDLSETLILGFRSEVSLHLRPNLSLTKTGDESVSETWSCLLSSSSDVLDQVRHLHVNYMLLMDVRSERAYCWPAEAHWWADQAERTTSAAWDSTSRSVRTCQY